MAVSLSSIVIHVLEIQIDPDIDTDTVNISLSIYLLSVISSLGYQHR